MNIKSISFKELESKTKNIYEAVVVISHRARQVLHDRLVEKMLHENTEEELGVLDEIPEKESIIHSDKPSSVAVEEFLSGDLDWSKSVKEEVS
jgi:hypothetical protein|tara:strand:+ start:215 stop:493 length:279 start_codon:yes stop_codon:yes gene_type:complete